MVSALMVTLRPVEAGRETFLPEEPDSAWRETFTLEEPEHNGTQIITGSTLKSGSRVFSENVLARYAKSISAGAYVNSLS